MRNLDLFSIRRKLLEKHVLTVHNIIGVESIIIIILISEVFVLSIRRHLGCLVLILWSGW